MFLSEFSPLFREISQQPIAFFGGFVSGMLRLNLADDPVKSWLDQQAGPTVYAGSTTPTTNNGNGNGPQSISID